MSMSDMEAPKVENIQAHIEATPESGNRVQQDRAIVRASSESVTTNRPRTESNLLSKRERSSNEAGAMAVPNR